MQISWRCSVRLCLEYLVHSHWPTFGPGLSSSLVLLYTWLCGPPSIFDLPHVMVHSKHTSTILQNTVQNRISHVGDFKPISRCMFLPTHPQTEVDFRGSASVTISSRNLHKMLVEMPHEIVRRKWIMGLHCYCATMYFLILVLPWWRKIHGSAHKKINLRFGLTLTWCKADSTYVHQSILG